jgi:saccharopine dehydrogenase (NADP+, L-glutamate forming)
VRVLCDLATRVSLWNRSAAWAEQRLATLGLSGRAAARTYDPATFAAELGPGDVVVSMLPATEHLGLLQLCVARGAHFACSSYVSEPILDEVPAATRAGLVVLAEAGLDPGIDHLLAHRLVALGRAATGDRPATATFTSYCGGLSAVPNPFRYRFSWAPRGVLAALLSPARYLSGGEERTATRPWEATSKHRLAGETFEVYPNRDSLGFIEQYGVPGHWRLDTFVRGTLRLDGWRDAWADVFDVLRTGDGDRIAALADDLAARYPTTPEDRDRVVLSVGLGLRTDDGATWSGHYHLDVAGDRAESAMARCVSLPLAFGVAAILDGTTPPGLHRAAEDADEAAKWLDFLEANGIRCAFKGSA